MSNVDTPLTTTIEGESYTYTLRDLEAAETYIEDIGLKVSEDLHYTLKLAELLHRVRGTNPVVEFIQETAHLTNT